MNPSTWVPFCITVLYGPFPCFSVKGETETQCQE